MSKLMNSKLDRTMTEEQFTQVVDAILDGKYSWACVLILRFAGYNPLHYIPYRTYNRLMKEHLPRTKRKVEKQKRIEYDKAQERQVAGSLDKIKNLEYVEVQGSCQGNIAGGFGTWFLQAGRQVRQIYKPIWGIKS